MQLELIDSLLKEIKENITPKVEGESNVTINKNHHGKNDTMYIKVISRITSMVGPCVLKLSALGTLFETI